MAAFRLQAALTRRSPGQFLILATAPLFSVIFLSLAVSNHSTAKIVNAVLAPGLIGLWAISLDVAGSIISDDRWEGRLELYLGSPASLPAVLFGRILVVIIAGGITFLESWLVAVLLFRLDVPIRDPALFTLTLVITCLAAAGTATLLAAAFVLSRALHVFQNSLTYPFYILGGVLVPVAALPGWLSPVSRVVFLSWSATLLRDATSRPRVSDWVGQEAMVLLLGAAALTAGYLLISRITDRLRATGEVNRA
jgi:ABC-2 type transport system permease protein